MVILCALSWNDWRFILCILPKAYHTYHTSKFRTQFESYTPVVPSSAHAGSELGTLYIVSHTPVNLLKCERATSLSFLLWILLI